MICCSEPSLEGLRGLNGPPISDTEPRTRAAEFFLKIFRDWSLGQ